MTAALLGLLAFALLCMSWLGGGWPYVWGSLGCAVLAAVVYAVGQLTDGPNDPTGGE